jgi:hypothetical protein
MAGEDIRKTRRHNARRAGMRASRRRGGASSVAIEEMSKPDSREAASPHRQLLRTGAFLRLWTAGGFTNAMRWLEILVAGLFVFEVTRSAFAVAVVTMMRSVPMLVAGALAGVVAESLDRKRLLLAGQALNAATAALLAVSGALGLLSVWQLALASLCLEAGQTDEAEAALVASRDGLASADAPLRLERAWLEGVLALQRDDLDGADRRLDPEVSCDQWHERRRRRVRDHAGH